MEYADMPADSYDRPKIKESSRHVEPGPSDREGAAAAAAKEINSSRHK